MATKEERAKMKLTYVLGAGALGYLGTVIVPKVIAWFRKQPDSASASTDVVMPPGDPVVGPAYPYMSKWTATDRAALYNAQKALGLDVSMGAIPGVIQHESGGDPTAPHQAEGTPRGGLIQLTQGARLPGFDTADSVWAVRDMSIPEQCEKVIVPYYARMHLAPDTSPILLMRKNFLPGVATKPDSFVLGVKDGATGPNGETSSTQLISGQSLTLGQIYKNNIGFARGKDYFTWADVDADSARTVAKAKGSVITVSGKVQQVSA